MIEALEVALLFRNMILYLALKNITARKSSLVIVAFISFAIMLLFATNAVFDSTERGIEEAFTASFCGDVVIRPVSDVPLSLFGDETPVTGELSDIPCVIPFDKIVQITSDNTQIECSTAQVTGNALMEFNGVRLPVPLFGVEAEEYTAMMSAIHILEGNPFPKGERGLMLSKNYAKQLGAKLGDTVQFSVADGISFRIRAVKVYAIYEYAVENATLDKIVLIDAITLRALMDMSDTVRSKEESGEEFSDNLDDLFLEAEDTEIMSADVVEIEDIIAQSAISNAEESENAESMSWNFIILRLKDKDKVSRVIKELNRAFKKLDYPAQAVDWRKSAGSTALYLYWMRLILNVGILIVLFAGFIVINNTLVINVLDRIREIGTMRAIGAARRFVSAMCMAETLLLALVAGVLGSAFGALLSIFINQAHIKLTNDFLIQLFGSSYIVTTMTFSNVLRSFMISLVIGLVSWIYPVITALKASPVEAMQGGK